MPNRESKGEVSRPVLVVAPTPLQATLTLDGVSGATGRRSVCVDYLYYNSDPSLKRTLDMIRSGFFSPGEPDLFRPIADSLLYNDTYMLCADYKAYMQCQAHVSAAFSDTSLWAKMSVLNTASMGKFSSDRTIDQYAREIWGVEPVPISVPANHKQGG